MSFFLSFYYDQSQKSEDKTSKKKENLLHILAASIESK